MIIMLAEEGNYKFLGYYIIIVEKGKENDYVNGYNMK